MYDPLVLDRKNVFMQRIIDYARHGYVHWTSGFLPLEDVPRLALKFALNYRVDLDVKARMKLKEAKLGAATLLLFKGEFSDPQTPVTWVLMVNDGDHAAHKLERLGHVMRDRIEVSGYELVRLPRPEKEGPSWTWRMTAEKENEWRRTIEKLSKKAPRAEIERKIYTLYQSPGFAGIRQQVGFLMGYWRGTWKRVRGHSEPFPKTPEKLAWVQRLSTSGKPLSRLLRSQNDARSVALPNVETPTQD